MFILKKGSINIAYNLDNASYTTLVYMTFESNTYNFRKKCLIDNCFEKNHNSKNLFLML